MRENWAQFANAVPASSLNVQVAMQPWCCIFHEAQDGQNSKEYNFGMIDLGIERDKEFWQRARESCIHLHSRTLTLPPVELTGTRAQNCQAHCLVSVVSKGSWSARGFWWKQGWRYLTLPGGKSNSILMVLVASGWLPFQLISSVPSSPPRCSGQELNKLSMVLLCFPCCSFLGQAIQRSKNIQKTQVIHQSSFYRGEHCEHETDPSPNTKKTSIYQWSPFPGDSHWYFPPMHHDGPKCFPW